MLDQLIIGDKASLDDFEASVKERVIHAPKKKSIKETVPFSNVTHDFSAINGEVYWEERTLEYVFEIIADSAEELEEKKQPFISWIMNVMNEKLYDPFIADYHFIATYDDMDIDDSEFEKATITVKFTAYPYKIANHAKVHKKTLAAGKNADIIVFNNSSHRLIPKVTVSGHALIRYGNVSIALQDDSVERAEFMLAVGSNTFFVENLGEAEMTLTISFYEEVL